MARKFRIPGLQIPASADGETLAFFNALKERLELIGGERGDPEQRSVSLRELRESGLATVQTQNQVARILRPRTTSTGGGSTGGGSTAQPESLDLSLLPLVSLGEAGANLQLLLQGTTTNDRVRMLLGDLFQVFARVDQESAPLAPWSFQGDPYGFDISGPAPRFRLIEQSEDSDTEPSRPADENIWEIEVNESELGIWLVNDDDDTRVQVLSLPRTGTVGDAFNVLTTALQHNGEQVLVEAGVGLDKTGDTVSLDHLGFEDLTDPGGDRVQFWDDSAGALMWLTLTSALPITGDVLDVDESVLDHNALDNLDVGDPHTQYMLKSPPEVTPAQITADQNDYDPGAGYVVRLSSDAARVITGMVPGNREIYNVGAFNITLSNENVASAAANRFALVANIVIPPNGSTALRYDVTSTRHRCSAAVLT